VVKAALGADGVVILGIANGTGPHKNPPWNEKVISSILAIFYHRKAGTTRQKRLYAKKTPHRKAGAALQRDKKVPVGAIIDRPWILLSQNPSPQGEYRLIFLRKIRKTMFFGGRPRVAPTAFPASGFSWS
jgi:hypothetical protein